MKTRCCLCLALSLSLFFFFFFFIFVVMRCVEGAVPPPLPILPIPSASQLSWQTSGLALFFHFGMNTFTDSEWGSGQAPPTLFNPQGLNARQWIGVAKKAGFSRVILTAKHHDGFCLWPSAYTNYTVASSPWRNGRGDVVGELAQAARDEDIAFGIYLSPWDRHESSYGDTVKYNEFYLAQLGELLTKYGPIAEVWLDGAKGEDAPYMEYLFDEWFMRIRQLQPDAVIFSDAGPDARWVGDEGGEAGSTCWSIVNRTSITIGNTDLQYLNQGDPNGVDWVPPECDVSIRPGWFWHRNEQPKSVTSLLNLFYNSVGRNCVLLLNVPPNATGLLPREDILTLKQFSTALYSIFSVNLAENATVTADSIRGADAGSPFAPDQILSPDLSTYWAPQEGQKTGYLQIDIGVPSCFNVVRIQEAISMGQRVIRYHVDIFTDGAWQRICNGTTVGYKRLHRIQTVNAQHLKLVIDEAKASPLIASFGLYLDTTVEISDTKNCSQINPEVIVEIGKSQQYSLF
eukprot:c15788_g1_i1 orf=70-1614(-)